MTLVRFMPRPSNGRMIDPTSTKLSNAALMAAIRELENAGVLTAFEAGRARGRVL